MAIIKTEDRARYVVPKVKPAKYWWAVAKNGEQVICLDCLDDENGEVRRRLIQGEEVEGYRRIYVNEDWQWYPHCCVCGVLVEYVNLLEPDNSYNKWLVSLQEE